MNHIKTLPFTADKEKEYPYFSYMFTYKEKYNVDFKLKASQVIHFPIQPTLPLPFKTSENEIIFSSSPHPCFNSRFNSTFNFLQVYQKTKLEAISCSEIIKNVTHNRTIF